jgi:curved DNA-binding protein CbpA
VRILGSALPAAARLAYLRLSLALHPDKVPAGASADDRELATVRFQVLGAAYDILRV